MKKIAKSLYFIYRPIFILIVVLDTTVLGILVILLSFVDSKGNRVHYIGKFWARLNILLSGVRIEVENIDVIDRQSTYVVMCNHQSYYDVWALIGFLPLQLRWVIKKELRKIPIFGLGYERMGQIFIDRCNPEKAYKSLESAGQKIRNGASVVFFPEGTRSPDGRLLPFKKGGFKIALAAGVPILPATVVGSKDVLPKKSLRLMPGTIRLIIHEPIPLTGWSEANMEGLMDTVKKTIQAGLDTAPEA